MHIHPIIIRMVIMVFEENEMNEMMVNSFISDDTNFLRGMASPGIFKELTDVYRADRQRKKEEITALQSKIIDQSVPAFNSAAFAETNALSQTIVENQAQISQKVQTVRDEWDQFHKVVERWITLLTNLDLAISEVGNIQSWAGQLQTDIVSVVEKLEGPSPPS
jgi:uncharacterized protein YicC (UPF0701 family)